MTGANGDIGRRLCEYLGRHSYHVVAGLREDVHGPWDSCLHFDLLTCPIPTERLQGISCIFHLAGKAHAVSETSREMEAYEAINVEGTRKLLEASRDAGVRRFVYFSSVKAINEGGEGRFDENTKCRPETPYGRSKLAAEELVLQGGYVSEPVILRPSMVYAPTRKGNLPRMIKEVARHRFPPLPELGNHRSMVHIDDVVHAALLAAQLPQAVAQKYIVTDGHTYSTRQVFEWICCALGQPVPRWAIPKVLLQLLAKVGDGIGVLRGRRFVYDSDALDKLAGSAVYSSEKICRELGFSPKRDLHSALPEIIEALNLKNLR